MHRIRKWGLPTCNQSPFITSYCSCLLGTARSCILLAGRVAFSSKRFVIKSSGVRNSTMLLTYTDVTIDNSLMKTSIIKLVKQIVIEKYHVSQKVSLFIFNTLLYFYTPEFILIYSFWLLMLCVCLQYISRMLYIWGITSYKDKNRSYTLKYNGNRRYNYCPFNLHLN
jgi:hypothetical protein